MSSNKFNGFTQEDINKQKHQYEKVKTFLSQPGIRRVPDKKPQRKVEIKKPSPPIEPTPPLPQQPPQKEVLSENAHDITSTSSDDGILSSEIPEILKFRPASMKEKSKLSTEEKLSTEAILHLSNIQQKSNAGEVDSSPFKGMSLKDFEAQRRLLKEQNKQKKEMLYKAIEQHSERTAAEARKIQEIKGELTKLDSDLAADVAILRKHIDSASLQYSNVQKQYHQIEAQFLKAKMDLHHACEKKELLTEHLCTIIAHNEDRKAQKLSELMEKVGISPTGEFAISEK